MSRDDAQSISGKVFDTDSNPVSARLLVWGPEEVDGERCVIAEPTDFFYTAPHAQYEGQERAGIAADDLRIAIPVRLFAEAKSEGTAATEREAREVSRRAALKGMRFDFLRDHGQQDAAVDYEDGTVTLAELLRRLDREPEIVFAIAGWLEEDAAESTEL